MKTKLVLWGTNAQEERVLIALELLETDNKVNLYTFPAAIVTDAFDKALHEKWREGEAIEMPEGHTKEERALSLSDGLLPETLKVERTDLISRAQTEWHFIVLSSKLNDMFESELKHLKGKVEELTSFDQGVWDNLREFWDKINTQTRERNLLQKQAGMLRDNTNKLFEELKSMKAKVNEEFATQSKSVYDEYIGLLDEIEKRMTSGNARFNTIFDDLKRIQGKFKDATLTGAHRSKLWDRIDGLFKASREQRFGKGTGEAQADPTAHLTNRLTGLNDAINRMQSSINYDKKDLDFERNRMASTSSQLEMQLREAKLKMIEERFQSKTTKLNDMLSTREKVESQLKSAQARAEKVAAAAPAAPNPSAEKAATKAETAAEPKSESILDAINNVLSEPLENMITSVKAVAEVLGEKLGDTVAEWSEKAEKVMDIVTDAPTQDAAAVATPTDSPKPKAAKASPKPKAASKPSKEAPETDQSGGMGEMISDAAAADTLMDHKDEEEKV
jgi:septal ring factor EnvC (AmiA/AmiB activator)